MDTILKDITSCCITISNLIRNNNVAELGSVKNSFNSTGDKVKQLDITANNILVSKLYDNDEVRYIGSEEEPDLITVNPNANYLVCFDPLDGSSNIDVNITVGTIFAIYDIKEDGIDNGRNIVLAGYCLYGGMTELVIAENKVISYRLHNNKFIYNQEITIPKKGNIYSINESNKYRWVDPRYRVLVNKFIDLKYTQRWVGSLVADAHRTLLKGGFFCYPSDNKNKNGKLRLLYEVYPFAYIFETAGGVAIDGDIPILDISYPSYDPHHKVPVILSSKYEMKLFRSL